MTVLVGLETASARSGTEFDEAPTITVLLWLLTITETALVALTEIAPRPLPTAETKRPREGS